MLGKCWFSQFVLQIKCCQKILYSSIIAWSHRHLTFADLFFWLRTAISLDWCHRNIRGSKMSLPNVLYGVKWTWRLWNAYEIRGLHSVCCSAFCMALCMCVCAPQAGSAHGAAFEQGQEESWEPIQKQLSNTERIPLNCVAGWLKISKLIH